MEQNLLEIKNLRWRIFLKSEINATIAKYEKRKCNVALHDQQKNIAFKFPRVKNVLHYSAYRAILLARFYTMKSTFDELKDLIDYIQSVYTEITIVSLEQSSAAHS